MQVTKVLFFSALALSFNAQAQVIDVSVNGKTKPPGCKASIGGAGLSWGDISWASLSPTQMTTLPRKPITLQVQCPAGTKIRSAFWATDPKAASAQTGPDTPSANHAANHEDARRIFGLGMDPVTGQKLGNFAMISTGSSFDGTQQNAQLGFAGSGDHTATAFAATDIGWAIPKDEDWTVWDSTANAPAAASMFTFSFDVEPQLNTANKITATQEVEFSGLAQFNVRYF